jgi:hypothetical protein
VKLAVLWWRRKRVRSSAPTALAWAQVKAARTYPVIWIVTESKVTPPGIVRQLRVVVGSPKTKFRRADAGVEATALSVTVHLEPPRLKRGARKL